MNTFYSPTSPYYTTPIVNDYLDVINFRDIPQLTDDHLFVLTATYQFRPDLLSYDLYKTPKLWWVFALRNKDVIKDPVFDMVAGVKIYLPKLSTIKRFLGI